jgi:hypothetical protein
MKVNFVNINTGIVDKYVLKFHVFDRPIGIRQLLKKIPLNRQSLQSPYHPENVIDRWYKSSLDMINMLKECGYDVDDTITFSNKSGYKGVKSMNSND